MKLYLVSSPSSSRSVPLKNYFASNAAINKNKIVSTPRLPIADRDLRTVLSNILSYTNDLIILKTLANLKALNTDKPEFSD